MTIRQLHHALGHDPQGGRWLIYVTKNRIRTLAREGDIKPGKRKAFIAQATPEATIARPPR